MSFILHSLCKTDVSFLDVHEGAFICFIIFSIAYMLDTCVLLKTLADEEKSEKVFEVLLLQSNKIAAFL